MDEKKKITKAAGVMAVATSISRVLGYVKDMILAAYFGATGTSDVFFAAFRIPNLLRELFAEGSMSSAFIPVLTEYRQKSGEEEAKRLVKITFTFLLILVGIICVVAIIFAPVIVSWFVRGFAGNPEKISLTVLLTRVMFPFLLFISLAALTMGALNTKRVFFIPALAPAMLNIAIIICVVLLITKFKQPIVVAAIGVALGGLIQFAFQLPSFFKNGYSLAPDYNFRHPGLRKMFILILPVIVGMAVPQINIFISTVFASYLPEGSITYLYYSMRLIQFPIGIFGVSIGMALLPSLSEHAVKGNLDDLRDDFSFGLRMLFFITVPAMAGLIALREPVVNLLFQRGTFDYAATVGTANALLFYSLGIWAIAGVRVVTMGYYSMKDTKTPVKIAVVALLINIIFSYLLMKPMKHSGLALASSISATVNFSLLFFFLRKKLKRIDGTKIMQSFFKICFSAGVMGVVGWFLLYSGSIWTKSGQSLEKIFSLSITIFICAGIYFGVCYILNSEEMEYVLNLFKKKFLGGKSGVNK